MATTSGRTRAYRLYAGNITATANDVANIQIPQNGIITGWSFAGECGVDDGAVQVELATTSVSTITQNDTPGTSLHVFEIVSTTTGGSGAGNGFVAGVQIPVTAGDRLYLHSVATSATAKAWFTVFITH